MTEQADIPLNLDASGYVTGANEAVAATDDLTRAVGQLSVVTTPLQRVLDQITPKRASIVGLGAMSAAAAQFQRDTAGIAATARTTHQPLGQLDRDVQTLAARFPVGTAGAIGMVTAVQQLGVQAPPRIRAVATEMERLAFATGSAPTAIALSFGQLNREMASLDPNRLSRFGDVVTTVAARSGAGATDLISFARGIAPIAQQAGIGEAAVIGISGAFAKLGDDGYAAVNAVNKILGDLNRSVREGSNDMAAYAQITGMTVSQFHALYQANPAQALAAVTGAIGKSGARGSYQLETLGLEGVRTQRALLELSQSGGLQDAITQAVGSYGSGATRRASTAATSGLYDEGQRVESQLAALGQTLGGPVLKPLTQVTELFDHLVSPLTAIAGNRGLQDVIQVGAYAGLGGFALRRLLRPEAGVATATLAATSGPVRGFFGGVAAGRAGGDLELASRQGVLSRLGGDMLTRSYFGAPLGRGVMGTVNARAMALGSSVGGFFPLGAGGGYGVRQAISDVPYAGAAGLGAYLRTQAEMFRLARTPAADRQLVMRPYGAAYDRFAANRQTLIGAREQGQLSGADYRDALGREFASLRDEVRQTGPVFAGMRQAGSGFLAVLREGALFGGYAGAKVARGVGGALLSGVGGPVGAAAITGFAGYQLYQRNQSEQRATDEHVSNLDIYSTLNAYRDSMGLAGQATVTLADQMKAAASSISTSVSTMSAATTVSGADYTAARSNPKVVHRYSGTEAQVGAQIAGTDVGRMSPQDVQAAKIDLLRQQQQGMLPPGFDIDRALAYATGSPGKLSDAQVSAMVTGAAAAPGLGHVGFGWRSVQRTLADTSGEGKWGALGHTGAGTPQLGSTGQGQVDLLLGVLGQTRQNAANRGGDAYGVQRELHTADTMMRAALATHNSDLVVGMEQQFTKALTGTAIRGTSASDIANAGGFLPWLRTRRGLNIGGYGLGAVMGASPTAPQSPLAVELGGRGTEGLLGLLTGGGAAQGAVGASINQPDNLRRQTRAVNTLVDAAQSAGVSLGSLARQSAKAASGMNPNDVTAQIMQGVLGETQFRLGTSLVGATRAESFGQRGSYYSGLAASNLPGEAGQAARSTGRQGLQQLYADQVSYYQQRLLAQFQFQVQSTRSEADYERQVTRSEQDFFRQRYRAERDFRIQISRERQDAATQMYDPYTRIAVQPVWDAVNLVGNEQEQIRAMRRQIENIKRLRRLGLDEAAIRQLGLYDPSKAQQTDELVADMSADRSLVGQENQIAKTRQNLAGQLLTQSPDYRRQVADFHRALHDNKIDYDTAMSRAQQDFNISMQRMAEDLHNADLEMTNDMTLLQKDMTRVLHGQQVDFSRAMHDGLAGTLDQVQQYMPKIRRALHVPTLGSGGIGGGSGTVSSGIVATGGQRGGGYGGSPVGGHGGGTQDTLPGGKHVPGSFSSASTRYVKPGTGRVYTGATTDAEEPTAEFQRRHPADVKFNQSIAASMKPAWWKDKKIRKAWIDLWNAESGWNQYDHNNADPNGYGQGAYGIPQAYPGHKMATFGKDWQTNPATQIKWGIDYIERAYHGTPYDVAMRQGLYTGHYKGYASGGIALTPHVGVVAESGGKEAMVPLDRRGVGFLVEAMRTFIHPDEARSMAVAGAGIVVHVHDSHTEKHSYDQGTHFHGPVRVESPTPEKFERWSFEQRREHNASGPRGVAWTRS